MGIRTENNSNHASMTTLIFTHRTLKRGFSNHVLMQDLIKTGDAVFNGIYRNEQGSLQRGCRVWDGGVLRAVRHRSYAIEIAFSCYFVCNFASFILHLHRFDFKRPKRTTSFPGCVCIKKQRGWVSAGFVRVARVLPGQLLGEFLLRLGPVPGPGRPGAGSTRRASPDFKTMIPSQYLPLSITLTQLHALSANVVQSMTTTRNLHLLWRFLQISPDGIQHPIRFSMM